MRIERARPPNYDDIVAVFPFAKGKPVYFTYGDTIFNPAGVTISRSLMAHEEVHSARQQIDGPQQWWARYLLEPAFRLEEELAAHRCEYAVATQGAGRGVRRSTLKLIAQRLAGPLYGKMISLDEAKRLIAADTAS